MKRIGQLIRGLLQDIASGDDSIVNRTQHMLNKSRRSLHNTIPAGLVGEHGDNNDSNNPMMDDSPGRRSGKRSQRLHQSGVSTNTAKTSSS
ncbi:MAG: hypothetical protein SGARI_007861, partial [Bacillariaceae sp.]